MAATMFPQSGSDVLWTVFSLLTVDPQEEVAILGGLPFESSAQGNALAENPAVYLLGTLATYEGSWLDEFAPCPKANLFFATASLLSKNQSYESFLGDLRWMELRRLAHEVLSEAGLEPVQLPSHIDFADYIEIVKRENIESFLAIPLIKIGKKTWISIARKLIKKKGYKIKCLACNMGLLYIPEDLVTSPKLIDVRIYCDACMTEHVIDRNVDKKVGK